MDKVLISLGAQRQLQKQCATAAPQNVQIGETQVNNPNNKSWDQMKRFVRETASGKRSTESTTEEGLWNALRLWLDASQNAEV